METKIISVANHKGGVGKTTSWSQTKKLELVLFKLKFREPLYLLGFSEISFVFLLVVTSHKKETLPFGDVSFWVPGRTRTVEIQYHNLTL